MLQKSGRLVLWEAMFILELHSAETQAYIDARYGDPDLSLALLADQFDISQPYLSSLFKQTHGINLSTYIENIRIEKAKDFLKTTDLTINKISEMVGYGSTNSFCRAFKRVTGISTSEYRKS